jgi:hypothetical protein
MATDSELRSDTNAARRSSSDDRSTKRSYSAFYWFTALVWVGAVVAGVVVGLIQGAGTGFGDTSLAPLTATVPHYSSFAGDLWRIAVSLAALALLPVPWFWFLGRLGDFGSGEDSAGPDPEEELVDSLRSDELRQPFAAAFASRVSLFSLIVLLTFGNFFVPYVLVRWGWGVVS